MKVAVELTMFRNVSDVELAMKINNPYRNKMILSKENGKVYPVDFIQQIVVTADGVELAELQFSSFMRENPNLLLIAKKLAKGKTISITWLSSLGKSGKADWVVLV